MFALVLAVVVMTSLTHAKQMEPSTLEGFQSIFYGNIMTRLDAEYKLLQPAIEHLNTSMEACRVRVTAAQDTCKTCAQSHCQKDFGDFIAGGWGEVTGFVGGAGKSFVDWKGWKSMGNWFEGAGKSIINWEGFDSIGNFFGNVGSSIGSGFGSIGSSLGSFGKTIGSGLGSFGSSIGSGFSKVGSSIGSGLGKLFGRRRRDVSYSMTSRRVKMVRERYLAKRMEQIDAETRACMEKCNECSPFLGDEAAIIGGVCGDELLVDQAALTEVMGNMEALFNANGHPEQGTTPILTMIEYDESSFDFAEFSVGGVYVTAETPNGRIRYASSYRYRLQFPQTTADELSQELMNKWDI